MSPFPFTLVGHADGHEYLTILIGADVVAVNDDHPQYDTLREAVKDPDATAEDIRELADASAAVAAGFDQLSERVSVANGRIYFDNDEVDTTITQHILRHLEAGEDFTPLVAFMENVAANPSEHSREQLYNWLAAYNFTITPDGNIVAYKGVREYHDEADVFYGPSHAYANGYAIVNGERQAEIRTQVGDTVELPRSEVVHDPGASCSFGLHVGTYDYARGFSLNGALLEVAVNPRDVVSVPNHASEKMRVCRYTILDLAGPEYDGPLAH